jgi:hypothetical protein
MIQRFKDAKIELMTAKTRAFSDLIDSVNEAERSGSILIIDSISHFWTELIDAFQKKNNVKRLQFQHWGIIKPEWRQFTDRYLTSKLHIIMCGRAGWEYEYEKDDDGVKELIKTGTKMNAEKEMGYEPSLLLEMEKYKKDEASRKIGGAFVHRCWVLKDRFDTINGHFFDNPTFENFLPHISKLNLGGEHNALDTSRTSEDMIASTKSATEWKKQMDIVLEEIKNEMTLKIPGKGADDQKEKINLLREVFKTSSWTEIENKKLEDLQTGLAKLKKYAVKENK